MYSNFNSNQNTFGYSYQDNQQYVSAPLVEQTLVHDQQQQTYGYGMHNVEPIINPVPAPIQMQPNYTINYYNIYNITNSGNTYNNTNCCNRKTSLNVEFFKPLAEAAGLALIGKKLFRL